MDHVYISADQGSVYGSYQYNTCFVNALVGALSLHGKVVDAESIDVLLASMRTTNGEFISPLDESEVFPTLHPLLAQLLAEHDAGIAFFTDGRRYVAFDADSSRRIVLKLNLVDHRHWEVLVDRAEYDRSARMARQEAMDRAVAQCYAGMAWV
jgi:hypothetical protein